MFNFRDSDRLKTICKIVHVQHRNCKDSELDAASTRGPPIGAIGSVGIAGWVMNVEDLVGLGGDIRRRIVATLLSLQLLLRPAVIPPAWRHA